MSSIPPYPHQKKFDPAWYVQYYAEAVREMLWRGEQPGSAGVYTEMCQRRGCCLNDERFAAVESAFFKSEHAHLWHREPSPPKPSHRSRKPITLHVRAEVWDQSNGTCYICESPLHPFRDFTIDHVIPVSKGGTDDIENLRAACKSCNSKKGAR